MKYKRKSDGQEVEFNSIRKIGGLYAAVIVIDAKEFDKEMEHSPG